VGGPVELRNASHDIFRGSFSPAIIPTPLTPHQDKTTPRNHVDKRRYDDDHRGTMTKTRGGNRAETGMTKGGDRQQAQNHDKMESTARVIDNGKEMGIDKDEGLIDDEEETGINDDKEGAGGWKL